MSVRLSRVHHAPTTRRCPHPGRRGEGHDAMRNTRTPATRCDAVTHHADHQDLASEQRHEHLVLKQRAGLLDHDRCTHATGAVHHLPVRRSAATSAYAITVIVHTDTDCAGGRSIAAAWWALCSAFECAGGNGVGMVAQPQRLEAASRTPLPWMVMRHYTALAGRWNTRGSRQQQPHSVTSCPTNAQAHGSSSCRWQARGSRSYLPCQHAFVVRSQDTQLLHAVD